MKRILSIIAITLVGFSLTACHSESKPKMPPFLPVNAMKIATSEIPITLNYIGMTKSIADVDIRARVQGFLEQMLFKEGSYVKKGTLLYVIDPRPFKAALDLAKANLDKSKANAEFQKVELKRKANLVTKNYVSQEEYDNQKATYDEAAAQVEVDQANVETAQINLGYCYMYSPINGIVGNRQVDVGNLVGTNQDTLLVSVVSLDPMFVYFSPSIDDFSLIMKYNKNMPFKIEATVPNFPKLKFSGKVDMVNNQANQQTSTMLMRGLIQNPKKILRPGIYVNVAMTISPKTKVIKIPVSAIFDMQGSDYVYVADKDNKAQLTPITVDFQTANYAVIKSGLKTGDILILDNLQKLHSGFPVKYTLKSKS